MTDIANTLLLLLLLLLRRSTNALSPSVHPFILRQYRRAAHLPSITSAFSQNASITLDWVVVGDLGMLPSVSLAPTFEKSVTGHAVVCCALPTLPSVSLAPKKFHSWNFADADWNRAEFLLCYNSDGSPKSMVDMVHEAPGVNEAASVLTSEVCHAMSISVPNKEVKIRKATPWMSRMVFHLLTKKNKAYKQWKRSGSPTDLSLFKKLHNSCRFHIRKAKENWAKELISEAKGPVGFWNAYRRMAGLESSIPTLITMNKPPAVSSTAKVNLLSECLLNNYSTLDSEPLPDFPADFPLPSEFICPKNFVSRFLHRLPAKSAVGLDKIRAPFLKGLAHVLVDPLVALINRCLVDHCFPSIWKENRITPIPKQHGTADPTEFRPISIAPIFSKLAESWLLQCLRPYLSSSSLQFAFKRGSSVEDAIATIQSKVADGFNTCFPGPTRVALISLDISKAFDQVSHRLLLHSLQNRGAPGSLLGLLKSYLSGRTQDSYC